MVPILMHLDSLPIVLDLREYAIRTLLHCIVDGLASLGLREGKEKSRLTDTVPLRAAQQGQPTSPGPGG